MFNLIHEDSETGSLSIRNTNKYVGSCRHMDDWTYIGRYQCIHVKINKEDMDGSETFHVIMVHTKVTNEDTIEKAIRGSFTSEGCSHEYDCCGCISTRVHRVRKLGPKFGR